MLKSLSPPPSHFRPAGRVHTAQLLAKALFTNTKYSGRRARGKAYERKAQRALERRYGEVWVPGPWFRFWQGRKWRYCQPDGLLVFPQRGRIVCLEIKLQHTDYAFHQLFALYIPVLQCAFGPSWQVYGCEVTRWYAPPPGEAGRCRLAARPEDINTAGLFVHILRG